MNSPDVDSPSDHLQNLPAKAGGEGEGKEPPGEKNQNKDKDGEKPMVEPFQTKSKWELGHYDGFPFATVDVETKQGYAAKLGKLGLTYYDLNDAHLDLGPLTLGRNPEGGYCIGLSNVVSVEACTDGSASIGVEVDSFSGTVSLDGSIELEWAEDEGVTFKATGTPALSSGADQMAKDIQDAVLSSFGIHAPSAPP